MDLVEAKALALDLMDEWLGETGGWTFRWTNAKRRFGHCTWSRKEIGLSRPLTRLNSVSHARDTILHEIAHAIAGRTAGHGPAWKQACRTVGCRPERCYSSDDVETPPAPWLGQCGAGCEFHRHRRLIGNVCKQHRNRIEWFPAPSA